MDPNPYETSAHELPRKSRPIRKSSAIAFFVGVGLIVIGLAGIVGGIYYFGNLLFSPKFGDELGRAPMPMGLPITLLASATSVVIGFLTALIGGLRWLFLREPR